MPVSAAFSPAIMHRQSPSDLPDLPDIVEAIGSDSFAVHLVYCLHNMVGADHCAIYRFKDFELTKVASATIPEADAVLHAAMTSYEVKRQLSQSGPSIRIDISNHCDTDASRLEPGARRRQRVIICARRQEAAYCLQVIRSAYLPELREDETEALRQVSGVLVSAIAKHLDVTQYHPNLAPALCTLKEIERCVISTTALSRRETEVCARILYGLSSCGIALDLGIGKESVMTYRKRAYQRLGIGSQRELLMWYLTLWSAWRNREATAALN